MTNNITNYYRLLFQKIFIILKVAFYDDRTTVQVSMSHDLESITFTFHKTIIININFEPLDTEGHLLCIPNRNDICLVFQFDISIPFNILDTCTSHTVLLVKD